MMGDIILDTNILADFLFIYYKQNVSAGGLFIQENRFSAELTRRVNNILIEYRTGEAIFSKGLVIASSFAFVEIARKFSEIAEDRFSLDQFKAFIESPPEWFVIEPVSKDLFKLFAEVPEKVIEADGKDTPIEWSDAIHIITAISRGETSILYTGDTVTPKIDTFKNRIKQL